MATDLTALKAAVKLVADAVTDGLSSGVGTVKYANLVPDALALLPTIGDIPTEISQLAAADYAALVTELASDLKLPTAKSEAVFAASIKLLSDLSLVLVPDVQAVIAATK